MIPTCGEQTGGLHSLGLKPMLFKRTDSRLHADPLLLIEGSDLAMDMRGSAGDSFAANETDQTRSFL